MSVNGKAEEKKEKDLTLSPKIKSYLQRLKEVALPCALAVFTVVFFGPLELCANNSDAIQMTALDSLPIISLVSLTAFLVLSLLSAIPWGKANKFVSALIVAVSVAAYVQGSFLNANIELLKGYEFPMQDYVKRTVINAFVWLIIIAAVVFVALKLKNNAKKVLGTACVVLILMQTTALVPRFFEGSYKKPAWDYSTENDMVLSENNNTLVFVLDCFSNVVMENTLEQYPDVLDGLNDFTYYRNYASAYKGTFPSMVIILTSQDYDYSKPYTNFFEDAWTSPQAETFYGKLHEMNYSVDVLCENGYISDKRENLNGKIDNIYETSLQLKSVNYPGLVYETCKLSAYRYSPYGLKRFFTSYPQDFESLVRFDNLNTNKGGIPPIGYAEGLYSRLKSQGISLTENNRMLAFHLQGAHGPYLLNKDVVYSPNETVSVEEQAYGQFNLVNEYISLMKELGIYDNSTIVIMADHGDYEEKLGTSSAIMFYKPKNASSEEMQISNAPVTYYQLLSTLAEDMGIGDKALYGKAFEDVDENEVLERVLYLWDNVQQTTIGKYNALFGYRYVGDINEQTFDGEPDVILEIADSFY